ncbi:hypothetical protein RCC89_10400 [Cytophagaceae bacterium ABcell3]|nr:hypothetical protein RCC89_10400 [Cytophagaceae bacterium ABcell3]
MDKIKKFEISYNINELPPPFSHQYLIKGTLEEDSPYIDFNVQYTNREELTEEEIYEEGFSPDDDFTWQGNLKPVWGKEIQKVLSNIKLKKNPTADIHLKVTDQQGNIHEGSPKAEHFRFFVEELIQAVYVTTGKEVPFTIAIRKIKDKQTDYLLHLTPDFSEKKVLVSVFKDKGSEVKMEYPWENLNALLKDIFSLDFFPEDALEKKPKNAGTYIDPGEGLWYKFGESAKNPENMQTLQKLDKLFDQLASHG